MIIIDTGMSSAYGGVLSALEITYSLHPLRSGRTGGHPQDPFSPNSTALGTHATYWEREEVVAIYESGRQRLALQEGKVTL